MLTVLAACCVLLLCLEAYAKDARNAKDAIHSPAASLRADSGLSQLKIDSWATEQGLPINTVQSIYQSRDGALWVGTASGLARFDGTRFTTFESPAVPELASRAVFGFMEDRDGTLWIGHSRGVAKYRNGRFEPAFEAAILQSRRAWSFAQAPDGAVWIATENGLLRWARKDSDAKGEITKHYKVADGLPTDRLRALTFDRDGVLWIATSGGGLVTMLPGSVGKFIAMNPSNGFPHLEVRHVLPDPAGGVWVATAGGGLVRVNGREIKTYTVADGLPTNQLTYLARKQSAKDGAADELWIGTWGAGVVRMRDGKFATMATAQGLGGDQVWSVHMDREGSLWAGSWNGGLNRLSTRVFGVIGKPEGLSNDNARAVIHDRNGVAWVTTAGGGVNRIEAGRTGGISVIGRKDGLATEESSGLLEDRDGAIWVASYTAGVSRINAQTKANGKFSIDNFGIADGLPSVDVRLVFQDKDGTLWAGTVDGLARFDGKRFAAVTGAGTEALREGVIAMRQDRNGTIWIGTAGKGLVTYANEQWSTFTRKEGLVSNWVLSLYEDANGVMWVGTNGEGINRIKDGRITAIRPADGLWDGTVQVILEDKRGNFWITCNRGFYYVPRRELEDFADGRIQKVTSVRYGPTDALRSTTFSSGQQPAGSIDANGKLWLPSLKGLVLVDPQNLPGEGAPPNVALHEVLINGKNQPTDEAIVLPPGSLPLSIRYAADTLLFSDRVSFRYRMNGLTPSWVEAGKNREATFASMPHGKYQFAVAATLDGKRWQELPQPLNIVVKPRFYETTWFMALVTLAGMAAVLGLYRLRTHQLHRRHAEMTRLVAEKTEALRLANEHLSQLSFSDSLTGLANRRKLDEMLETEWRRALRSGQSLAIVMIDIDVFKAYNDTLGHLEGDKCLIAVADVIREAASRAGDFAARYGGEEFIILIPGLTHQEAIDYAEKLRLACQARAIPHPSSPAANVVTISLGVAAAIPSAENTAASLIESADAALYRAKRDGRNMVR
jgi:diguanylate cyclase (GGDEF)-like protein